MRPLKHIGGEFGVFLLLLPLLLALFLLWAVTTTHGSRWTVEKLLDSSELPVEISGFSGRLIGNIALDHVQYPMKNTRVEMEKVVLTYNPFKLSRRLLSIESFRAERVIVKHTQGAKKRGREARNEALARWRLPIDISVNSLAVQQFTYQQEERPYNFTGITGHAELSGRKLVLSPLTFTHSEHEIGASGELKLIPDMPFELEIQTQTPKLAKLNFDAKGDLESYLATGKYKLFKPGLPKVSGRFSGHGDLKQFSFDTLKAILLDGEADLDGVVRWNPQLSADLQYQAKEINLQKLQPKVEAKADLSGAIEIQKQHIRFTATANANYRDQPVSADLSGDFHQGQLTLDAAKLMHLDNRLDFRGTLNSERELDIKFSAEVPQPEPWVPDLEGSISAEGTVNGTVASPRINLTLALDRFSYRDSSIEQAKISVSPQENGVDHAVNADLLNIDLGNQSLKKLTIDAKGNRNEFSGKLRIAGTTPGFNGSFEINGERSAPQNQWSGKIFNSLITHSKLPRFSQRNATQWQVSKSVQQLSPLCLTNREAEICLDTERQNARLTLNVNASKLSIGYLTAWLPDLQGLREALDGKLVYQSTEKAQDATFQLQIDSGNAISGELRHNRETDEIAGRLRGNFNRLEWINLLTDEIIDPEGVIKTEINLTGSTSSPQLSGFLRLTKGAARLPASGVQLEQATLDLKLLDSQKARIDGSMESGGGKLRMDGELSWKKLADWKLFMNFSGERFEAVNQPLARIRINPDIKLWASREGAAIQGTVKIPEGSVELANLPATAIQVSPDEIIIDKTDGNGNKRYPTHTVILVKLGDNVRLSGYGLDARFEGKLQLIQRANKSIVADGVLKIAEGSYTAYGQNLSTEFGQIYFNGPLNTPRLNLLASRKIDHITAGIRIIGTLDAPESHVYSIPVMPQTDALSYLLTGKPLRSTGQGEANILVNAAVRLGLKGGAGVINDIRTFADLDTLEIQPGEDLEQSAVIIGKYLTADLYLEYISQLFLGSDVISMRYDINDKVQLKAESSDTSKSIDLLYQFETR